MTAQLRILSPFDLTASLFLIAGTGTRRRFTRLEKKMKQSNRKASARAIKAIGAIGLVMGFLWVGLPVQPTLADGLHFRDSNFVGQLGDGTLIAHDAPVIRFHEPRCNYAGRT